jgi:hypothetical protein
MPTIYLPFTHISQASAARLGCIFGPLVLYHPAAESLSSDLQKLSEEGAIEIRVPPGADDQRLAAMKKEYRAWANLRQDRHGIDTGAFMASKGRIPFFDEDSTAQISSELKKIRAGEPAAKAKTPDPLLHGRLFLALAQEHDLQIAGLEQDLEAIGGLEKKLLGGLKGEADEMDLADLTLRPAAAQDPGAFMTVERIRAWSCLFLADTQSADCLVTDSRAVMDQLVEDVDEMLPIPGVKYLLGCHQGPGATSTVGYPSAHALAELARADDPLAFAEHIAHKFSSAPGAMENRFPGSGFLVPGIPPRRLFERFTDSFCRGSKDRALQGQVKHTIMAWLGV